MASLHPGTVKTDISAPFQKNVPKGKLFAVDDRERMLCDVIDCLGEEDTSSCTAYDRKGISMLIFCSVLCFFGMGDVD